MEWFGLEGTLRNIPFHLSRGQGHHSLVQAAPSPIQPWTMTPTGTFQCGILDFLFDLGHLHHVGRALGQHQEPLPRLEPVPVIFYHGGHILKTTSWNQHFHLLQAPAPGGLDFPDWKQLSEEQLCSWSCRSQLTGIWIPYTRKFRNPWNDGAVGPLCHNHGKCRETPALFLPWTGLGTFFKLPSKAILNNI